MFDEEIREEHDIFAQLAKAKAAPMSLRVADDEDEEEPAESSPPLHSAVPEDTDGQLTIDVFQDDDNIFVQSAVAGVTPEDLEITITKEAVTVRGKREKSEKIEEDDYFYQECFWGTFSRSVVLPQEVDPDKSVASLKNGVLTIKMPKFDRKKAKSLKVKAD